MIFQKIYLVKDIIDTGEKKHLAKKNVNRKKQLKKRLIDLKRAGRVDMERVREVTEAVGHSTDKVVEKTVEKVKETVSSSTISLEDFVTLPELKGLAVARLETFYKAGIQSIVDFASYTEKELLALKGIGPATIKQLNEKGIIFKN